MAVDFNKKIYVTLAGNIQFGGVFFFYSCNLQLMYVLNKYQLIKVIFILIPLQCGFYATIQLHTLNHL